MTNKKTEFLDLVKAQVYKNIGYRPTRLSLWDRLMMERRRKQHQKKQGAFCLRGQGIQKETG